MHLAPRCRAVRCLDAAEAAQLRLDGDRPMDDATIYHNPRCSKSRATLDLLIGRGLKPRVVNYLDTPPKAAEIGRLLDLLGAEPRDVIRKDEAEYAELKLANPALTRSTIIARSNSAKTPHIWNIALPEGVVVSIACWCR